MERTQRLLDGRIIREITPIFDTRALGYSSMLVAAKVDAENPHRAAKIINSHPGVSHNYLRTHEFNLWFTIATPPDSELGLEGTLEVLQELTGAESIRQLPTLTLFKINMNLEMEGGTEALARRPPRRSPPRELEAQPYDETDVAVIRALQGPMEVDRAPLRRRRGRGRDRDRRAARATCGGWSTARSCAASPRSSSTAAPASPPTGWASGGCPRTDPRGRRARWPRSAASRTATSGPTYADWPYSVFTMAHGRSKEECDAILDGIADEHDLHGDDRAVLYSSTEFKKVRLHYFTDDYAALGGGAASLSQRSAPQLYERALEAASRAASTRRCGRCARSAATRSSSSAARAPTSGTSTATATSTGSPPGGR